MGNSAGSKRSKCCLELHLLGVSPENITLLAENSFCHSVKARLDLGAMAGNQFEYGLADNTCKVYRVSFKPHINDFGGFQALYLYSDNCPELQSGSIAAVMAATKYSLSNADTHIVFSILSCVFGCILFSFCFNHGASERNC